VVNRSTGSERRKIFNVMRDATARRLSQLHRVLYRLTRGVVGRRLVDNDMLLLTTRGQRTGRPHTVPLLYLQDGDTFVVIASWGGRPYHPDWYHNLQTHPEALVQVRSKSLPVTARTATSDERDLWWHRVLAAYEGYRVYQSHTDRVIPVVFLRATALSCWARDAAAIEVSEQTGQRDSGTSTALTVTSMPEGRDRMESTSRPYGRSGS
jgi:deazaflavin-dependent oxidoreductase (nitroreductase family)